MKRLFSILLLMLALVMVLAACNGNDEVTISVDSDGYVIVNGVKTEHKVHTADEVTVNGDGFVVVNGVITNIIADRNDVITVDKDGYVVVNGVVTDIVADKDDVITVDKDGYVIVNGVKTEYEVKNKNHSFGAWKLYNEGETDCEKKLYHRICSECSTIEWKEGTYQDHQWTTVTTAPTCQAGGFDTKTCNACGKVEIGNETPVGEHTYLPNHSYDNGFHWLACQHCTNIKDKAEHTMDAEGVCTVCSQLVGDTEGVIYDISSDGTYAMVIDYTGTATRVKIAAEYQGLPVTRIYENAFKEKAITAVIIPDSVTTIGMDAFAWCSSLTSVIIGNGVTTIGYSAFSYCYGLTSVTIGNGVTTIGERAFSYCYGLTSVTIPDSVTTIGSFAFERCEELTSITFPDSVTTIGEYAFSCCFSLTSVTIPDSVTTIGRDVFGGCSGLRYAEYGNCKYLGSADNPYFALITVVNNNYSSYTIHEDTKIIADYAFSNCSRMTAITIPDSVTTIGGYAFKGCSSLTSVTIGNGVTTFGWYVFSECTELTSVTIPDSVTTIASQTFYGCSSLRYAEYGNCKYLGSADNPYFALITVVNKNYSTYTIHEDTKIIADYAFSDCSRMTAITIPDSVTDIGASAFSYCYSLTSVTIGNGVTSIGSYAFRECSSLTEIHFSGTKEQWQAISKVPSWNSSTGKYTIYCTDGDIKK